MDVSEYDIHGVSLFDVLEHIEDDFKAMNELIMKLKSGTRIYLTVPAHNYLWSEVDPFGGHFRRYNKRMIKNLSSELAVELEYFTYFF